MEILYSFKIKPTLALLVWCFTLFLSVNSRADSSAACKSIFTVWSERQSSYVYDSVLENLQRSGFTVSDVSPKSQKKAFDRLEKLNSSLTEFELFRLSELLAKLINPQLDRRLFQQIGSQKGQAMISHWLSSEIARYSLKTVMMKYEPVPTNLISWVPASIRKILNSKCGRALLSPTFIPELESIHLPNGLLKKIIENGWEAHKTEIEHYVPSQQRRNFLQSIQKIGVWISIPIILSYSLTHISEMNERYQEVSAQEIVKELDQKVQSLKSETQLLKEKNELLKEKLRSLQNQKKQQVQAKNLVKCAENKYAPVSLPSF